MVVRPATAPHPELNGGRNHMMTIVRSLGVTTLVALMSAHRAAAEQSEMDGQFDQATVEAIEAHLLGQHPNRDQAGAVVSHGRRREGH
jgi:hypothetical protein